MNISERIAKSSVYVKKVIHPIDYELMDTHKKNIKALYFQLDLA